jgi:ankyrin repeat protein
MTKTWRILLPAIVIPYAFLSFRDCMSGEDLYGKAQDGDAVGVHRLLRQGADPNYRFDGEMTPLWAAVSADDVAVVRVLLENGADPNLPVSNHLVLKDARSKEMERLLIQYGARKRF